MANTDSAAGRDGGAVVSAHSPLPWRIEPDVRRDEVMGYNVKSPDGEVIGCEGILAGERGKLDAALIVRAVNAHDELVAALRSIEGLHVPDQPLSSACDEHVWVRRHVAKLRGIAAAALAKLEQPA